MIGEEFGGVAEQNEEEDVVIITDIPEGIVAGNNVTDLVTKERQLDISNVLRKWFGFSEFREVSQHCIQSAYNNFFFIFQGQRECIERVLDGKSTLLIIPTGSGKSLCYQLPAFLLAGPTSTLKTKGSSSSVVLVVSPLVSLMQDQLRALPMCLNGALLSHDQTSAESERVFDKVALSVASILLHIFNNKHSCVKAC